MEKLLKVGKPMHFYFYIERISKLLDFLVPHILQRDFAPISQD